MRVAAAGSDSALLLTEEILVLATIVFMFALNLWGVFEIGMPSLFGRFAVTYGQSETPLAHYLSGLFATLLATPCAAPFLGTAMGFALTQTSATILIAFAAAGFGMALPYFVLAVVPSSLHWLPRPGFWMVRLKMLFGIFLAGTAMWLVWVFLQQIRTTPPEPFDESRIQTILAEGRPADPDLRQGIRVQRLMECLRQSAKQRRWIDVEK